MPDRYQFSPSINSDCKCLKGAKCRLERAPDVFKKGPSAAEKELKKEQQHVAELERKVGQLTYEVDWLKKKSDEIFKRKRP